MAVGNVRGSFETAKKYMIRHHPFYGSFLCTTEVKWTEKVPTAAVDGQFLYLNPVACSKLSRKEWRFLLAHEVQHLAHLHSFRQRKRHAFIWNMATDFVINGLLEQEGDMALLDDVLINGDFFDMSPEQVYDILVKNKAVQQAMKDAEKGKGQGQGQGQGQGNAPCPSCGKDNWVVADEQNIQCNNCGHMEEAKKGDGKGTACGTEDGTETRKIKIDKFHGDVLPVSEHLDPVQRQQLEIKARQMAYQAAFMARSMGKDTKTTATIIKGMEAPVDWVLQMNSFVDNVIQKDDYTWSRPRRRYVPWNIYLPDMGGTKPPKKLAVVLDVSGSIRESTLRKFLDELSGVIQANTNVSFDMYTVDNRIHDTRRVGAEDLPLEFDVSGAGGGTDFRPAFDAIEQSDEELPSGLIYFTDLECDRYAREPDFPVLWLNFGRPMDQFSQWRGSGPPYGEVVDMNPGPRI
jgi:predicted metal-dependent peptidase